jgi:hypothetical protein
MVQKVFTLYKIYISNKKIKLKINMKYKRFNENFNKIDSIDMKNIKVVFDFILTKMLFLENIYHIQRRN